MEISFKRQFVEKYSRLTDFGEYKDAVSKFLRRSIRVNTLKSSVDEVKSLLKDWTLTQIPWCSDGFYIENDRRDIGNAPGHMQGMFFVQSSVSMIPSVVLNPSKRDLVLDMAASPGGKTTHLASLMENKGLIIANDIESSRVRTLVSNLERCGVMNSVVTMSDALSLKGSYDRILLDAPCSASGLVRGPTANSIRTLRIWNQKTVDRLAKLQKKLITHAYSLLKEKGTLVYSTCTLEPEEDEQVVDHLLENSSAKLLPIDLPLKSEDRKYFKIWPQYNDTEGFFVAKIIRP